MAAVTVISVDAVRCDLIMIFLADDGQCAMLQPRFDDVSMLEDRFHFFGGSRRADIVVMRYFSHDGITDSTADDIGGISRFFKLR